MSNGIFDVYYPIWVKFDTRYQHAMPSIISEFCENRGRKGRTFLWGANRKTRFHV